MGILSTLLALAWTWVAADATVRFTLRDWQLDKGSSPLSVGPSTVAITLHQRHGDLSETRFLDYIDSRVVQIAGGDARITDFDGGVIGTEYSSDGRLLLVQEQVDKTDDNPIRRTHLVDSNGTILWTKEDSRAYSFSDTGEALFSVRPVASTLSKGTDVEVLDLVGRLVKRIKTTGEIRGAVVFGEGTEAVVCVGRTVVMYNLKTSPVTRQWAVELPDGDAVVVDPELHDGHRVAYQGVMDLKFLDEGRFVIQEHGGRLVFMNKQGRTEYLFDPDDHVTRLQGREVMRVMLGSDSHKVILYPDLGGRDRGFELDIEAGALKHVTFPPERASEKSRGVYRGRMVFLSPGAVRFQPVVPDPDQAVANQPNHAVK